MAAAHAGAEQGSRAGHERQNNRTTAGPADVLLYARGHFIHTAFGIRCGRSCVGSDEPS
jgi:hypothetical protein